MSAAAASNAILSNTTLRMFPRPDDRRNIIRLVGSRVEQIKIAFAARCLNKLTDIAMIMGRVAPNPGDLILVQIHSLGTRKRIRLSSGDHQKIFLGDEIVVCFCDKRVLYPERSGLGLYSLDSDLGEAVGFGPHGDSSDLTILRPLGLVGNMAGSRLQSVGN